jgi:hypothetical protein
MNEIGVFAIGGTATTSSELTSAYDLEGIQFCLFMIKYCLNYTFYPNQTGTLSRIQQC